MAGSYIKLYNYMYNFSRAEFFRRPGDIDKKKRRSRLIGLALGSAGLGVAGYLALRGKGKAGKSVVTGKPIVSSPATSSSVTSNAVVPNPNVSKPNASKPSVNSSGQREYDVMNPNDIDDLIKDVVGKAKEQTKTKKRLALVQNPDARLAQLLGRQKNNIQNERDIRLYNRALAKLADRKTTRKEYKEARAIVRNMEWGNRDTKRRKAGNWVSGRTQQAKLQIQNYFTEKGAFRGFYYHLVDFSTALPR